MASRAESRPECDTGVRQVSFSDIGKRALNGIENFLKPTIAGAIENLDLTTHIEISVPDKNFRILNAGVHPGQLIIDGLSGMGTKSEIVPKVAAVTSS